MAAIIRQQALAHAFLYKSPADRLADPLLRDAQLTLEVGFRSAEQQLGRVIGDLPDVAGKMTDAIARQLGDGRRFEAPTVRPAEATIVLATVGDGDLAPATRPRVV